MKGDMDEGQKGESGGSSPEFFVDIVGWLETGWEIYKRNWMPFSMVAFIFLTVIILAQFIPFAGNLVVMGPMTAGLFLVTAEIVSGRNFNPGTLFGGFKYFIPAFVANLLITLFTTIGFIFLIIPGIVIGGLYIFTYIFMVDRKLGFWESMEESRKVAVRDTVGFALFYFAMGAVNILGLLCMVVGVLVTLPVTTIAIFVAYEKLVGFESLLEEPERTGDDKAEAAPASAQPQEKTEPDSADPPSR
jgi:uncharacterized membrane protein